MAADPSPRLPATPPSGPSATDPAGPSVTDPAGPTTTDPAGPSVTKPPMDAGTASPEPGQLDVAQPRGSGLAPSGATEGADPGALSAAQADAVDAASRAGAPGPPARERRARPVRVERLVGRAAPGRGEEPARPRRAAVPRRSRLDLGDAIHDGWQAFCQAPRAFVVFALLANLLQVLMQSLMTLIGSRGHPSADPRAWLLFAMGLAGLLLINLWSRLSLVRAAWHALAGGHPTLPALLRWDGPGCRRLLAAWLRLTGLLVLPPAAAAALLGLPLLLLWEPAVQRALGRDLVRLLALGLAALLLISLALALASAIHLLVSQSLLVQVVVLEGLAGPRAVARGRRLVNPHWPLVLLLLIFEILLFGLGLAACAVGILVAWPAVICISTAAYRQLRQAELEALEPSA